MDFWPQQVSPPDRPPDNMVATRHHETKQVDLKRSIINTMETIITTKNGANPFYLFCYIMRLLSAHDFAMKPLSCYPLYGFEYGANPDRFRKMNCLACFSHVTT